MSAAEQSPERTVRRRSLAWVLSAVLATAGVSACDEPPRTSGATLIAGPVSAPPAPPARPTSLVPTAPVAPPGSAAGDPNAARAAWLAGPLTGRDNAMAHHREARITARADGTYELFVKNQFGFRCTLSFGPDGRPALFERCRSSQAGWRASPASLPVTCAIVGAEEACEGPFRLLYPSSGGSAAALRIVRRLTP